MAHGLQRRHTVTFHRLFVLLALIAGALAIPHATLAAPAAPPAASANGDDATKGDKPETEELEKVAPDSPRAAMIEFRRLARAKDYAAAAKFLDLSKADASEGATLAEHLKEVLARRLWVDPAKISPESRGNTADNQAADREELGTIRAASGNQEPVLLVRKSYRPGSHWVFAASTVAQIEGWYDHLENTWLVEHIPAPLLKMGPRLLRWWQWIALVPLLLAAWGVSWVATRLGRVVASRALSQGHADMAHQMHGPVTLAVMVAITYAALPWLALYQPAEQFLHRWCSAFLVVAGFWALWRGVELSRRSVSTSRWARESGSAHSLLSLGARLAKFAVAAGAFVIVLSQLGYQATTIITGLGIGGVALALAAQKTVENLFGTFSLAIDQPFREGDTIKVDGIDGLVEAVGLRSTRIRTADRTVISIPNGKLADMRVETVSRQDRLRFYCMLGLAHGASAQVTRILANIKALLGEEPLIIDQSISARFVAITDSAMNLEIAGMFDTIDGAKFADAKQQLLLGILQIVEEAGASIAHPMRRIEITSSAERAPDSSPRLSKTG